MVHMGNIIFIARIKWIDIQVTCKTARNTINALSALAIITYSIYVYGVFTGPVLDIGDIVMNKPDNVNPFKEFTF